MVVKKYQVFMCNGFCRGAQLVCHPVGNRPRLETPRGVHRSVDGFRQNDKK